MEIIYPPLVEEGLKYYLETTQQSLDKSTFYRSMVERGIITEMVCRPNRQLKMD